MIRELISFKPSNTAILLIDHQPGVLAMVRSVPSEKVQQNTAILARLGEQLDIPLIVTSTREAMDFLGPNLQTIKEAAPRAYAERIRRGDLWMRSLNRALSMQSRILNARTW